MVDPATSPRTSASAASGSSGGAHRNHEYRRSLPPPVQAVLRSSDDTPRPPAATAAAAAAPAGALFSVANPLRPRLPQPPPSASSAGVTRGSKPSGREGVAEVEVEEAGAAPVAVADGDASLAQSRRVPVSAGLRTTMMTTTTLTLTRNAVEEGDPATPGVHTNGFLGTDVSGNGSMGGTDATGVEEDALSSHDAVDSENYNSGGIVDEGDHHEIPELETSPSPPNSSSRRKHHTVVSAPTVPRHHGAIHMDSAALQQFTRNPMRAADAHSADSSSPSPTADAAATAAAAGSFAPIDAPSHRYRDFSPAEAASAFREQDRSRSCFRRHTHPIFLLTLAITVLYPALSTKAFHM